MSNELKTNKDVVALFFGASYEADYDTAVACFTDDGIWIGPEGPEPGKTYKYDEIRDYLIQQKGVLDDFHSQGISVEYGPLDEIGDKVYLEAAVRRSDGEILNRFVDVFTMRDGKIAVKDVFSKA